VTSTRMAAGAGAVARAGPGSLGNWAFNAPIVTGK
jgi:hypothetical protein